MPLPTVSQLKQALKLAIKLEAMEAELASILGEPSDTPKAKKSPGRPRKAKRQMSEEGRKRIAEAQKRRWQAQKKAASKA